MDAFPLTRRKALGLAAGAAALPFAPSIVRAQASGRCIVSTWGGDYARLLTENIEAPLLAPRGIEAVQDVGVEPTRVARSIAQRRLPRGTVDVICVQAPGAYDLQEAGMLEPLDVEKVPNLRHVQPAFATNYAIPHIYSPQVIAYPPERVTTPPTTFSDLQQERFRGKVGLLDNSIIWVLMAAALKERGDPGEFLAARPQIEQIVRAGVHTYAATDAFGPAMRSGEIDIGLVWFARVVFWRRGGIEMRAAFPAEGCMTYVSSMCVLKNAPNKAAAFAYLNAALEPSAQRGFAASMGYHPTVSNAPLEGETAVNLALPDPAPRLLPAPYDKLSAARNEVEDWWRRLMDRR